MSDKVRTTLYLDKQIVKKAKEMGLNISKTCENCLSHTFVPLASPQTIPSFPHEAVVTWVDAKSNSASSTGSMRLVSNVTSPFIPRATRSP